MRALTLRFLVDRRGATAIEYGMIIALLTLAIVGGVGSFGDQLGFLWGNNGSKLVQAMK